MGKYPRHCVKPVNQYSSVHHLSRKVRCMDCGLELHKNQDFVLHGSRCSRCWHEYVQLCNASFYTLHLWFDEVSTETGMLEPDLVVEVSALSALSIDGLIAKVMAERNMVYASYVWLVPSDENEEEIERFHVFSPVQEVFVSQG